MTQTLPVLPLRDIVVFPQMIVPLFVGRDKSVAALATAMAADKSIFLVSQLDPAEDDPDREALYDLGVVATVLQLLKLPDGTVRVLVEGQRRATLQDMREEGGHLVADIEEIETGEPEGAEVSALMRSVVDQFENYSKLNKRLPAETAVQLGQIEEASKLADAVAANINIKVSDKQALLAELDSVKRLEMVFAFMEGELGVLQVEKKIRSRVKRQMEKTQREYYLNEQLKAIQRELGNEGEDGEGGDELAELAKRIERTKLSKEAKSKAQAELKKLRAMAPMSAEATVSRNYLDVLLGLPWGKKSKVKKDIAEAQAILDEDHYGLEKVKDRIVEYLAVQARTNKLKGPILCLVGPPGVGKTSLGRSIARATGREFVRQSLGGVRDEAEIRGHRRTYIGSLPGKIVANLKKAGTSNPLFLLDEIDKLGQDFRGDPASALLEVLDPEQNSKFQDHYLEIDYDLSDIMFVTTANTMDMPQPLLDRMEIIRLEGYTEDEKVQIATRHLIPKQIEAHGLKDEEIVFTEAGVRRLIQHYTREAGVRTLEREIAKVARKVLRKGQIKTTGKLGDVMQESIQAAFSFVKARSPSYGVKPSVFGRKDIHVHLPEGATPKDGPSAGVGMVTAIISTLTGIPVRRDVAMTGEVTLRGRVLPIGGLKEKLLAALRGGITKVLIPQENEKDLADIPETIRGGLEIVPVSHVDEVLTHALAAPVAPIEWTEADELAAVPPSELPAAAEEAGVSIRH
jgi:ATP-dependent Lon protease